MHAPMKSVKQFADAILTILAEMPTAQRLASVGLKELRQQGRDECLGQPIAPASEARNGFSDSMTKLSNARVSLYDLASDVAGYVIPPRNQTGTEWVLGVLRLADRASVLYVPAECLFPGGGPYPTYDSDVERSGADYKYTRLSLTLQRGGQSRFDGERVRTQKGLEKALICLDRTIALLPPEAPASVADAHTSEVDGGADSTPARLQKPKRGRKVSKYTIQRADFAKPLREAGESWPNIFAKYESKHFRDTEATEDIVRRACERQYPELGRELKEGKPTE